MPTGRYRACVEENHWETVVSRIRAWSQHGERAPHKPLLLLYALGRLQQQGQNSAMPFSEVEESLGKLLTEFGPPHKTSPSYPFHHLTHDDAGGLWVVRTKDGAGSPGANVGALRSSQATGELAPEFAQALIADPKLLARIAQQLLDANWPETLHPDIAAAVGLDVSTDVASTGPAKVKKRRDPAFRQQVLLAYERRCAVCGWDGRLGAESAGLEAAHVHWWNCDGPDEVANGLCLCSLHHKLLDLGAIGITPEHTVAVSAQFIAGNQTSEHLVLYFLGKPLAEPIGGFDPLDDVRITWHDEQVFKHPPRVPSAA